MGGHFGRFGHGGRFGAAYHHHRLGGRGRGPMMHGRMGRGGPAWSYMGHRNRFSGGRGFGAPWMRGGQRPGGGRGYMAAPWSRFGYHGRWMGGYHGYGGFGSCYGGYGRYW